MLPSHSGTASAKSKTPHELPTVAIEPWMSTELGLRHNLLSTFAFVHHYSPEGEPFNVPLTSLAAFTGVNIKYAKRNLYSLSHRRLIDVTNGFDRIECKALICNGEQAKSFVPTRDGRHHYYQIHDNLHYPPKGITVPGWVLTDSKLSPRNKLLFSLLYQINRDGNIMGTYADLGRMLGMDRKTAQISLKLLHKKGLIRIEKMTDEGFVCRTRDIGATQPNGAVRLKVFEWQVNSLGFNDTPPLLFYVITVQYRRGGDFTSTYADFEKSYGFAHNQVNGYLMFLRNHGVLDVIEQNAKAFSCRPLVTDAMTAAYLRGKRAKGSMAPVARIQIAPAIRQRVFDRDGRKCRYCGSSSELTVDHIAPLSRGGTNRISNLQTLCADCNQMKGDRLEAKPNGFYRYPPKNTRRDAK